MAMKKKTKKIIKDVGLLAADAVLGTDLHGLAKRHDEKKQKQAMNALKTATDRDTTKQKVQAAQKVAKPKSSVSTFKTIGTTGPAPAQKEGRAYTAANPAPKPKVGSKYKTSSGKTGTVYNAPTEQLRKAKKMMNSLN